MSTYSPSLRVELITSGDQAGQWGNTTNENFAYIFDSAIAGYVDVTTIVLDHVLTFNNGPVANENLNQSIQALLRLDTSTGAPFNVFAPPVSKQYIIWNNSTLHAATIYNSSSIGNTTISGPGVTIAPGAKVLVFSTGAGFYEIKTVPAGSTTQIQYNNSGAFGASANLTFANDQLNVNGVTVGKGLGAVATNTGVGEDVLASNTTGNSNAAFGQYALFSNLNGYSNVAVGKEASYSNTAGYSNTSVGFSALWENTSGSQNTAIGNEAAYENTTGSNNTAVGAFALQANQTGQSNVSIGSESLKKSTGSANTFIGYQSGLENVGGNSSVAIGYQALRDDPLGSSQTAVGVQAMLFMAGSDNTAFGELAMRGSFTTANNTGTYNVAVGKYALLPLTSGEYNTAVGPSAGSNVSSGTRNVMVGYNAGAQVTTTSYNTYIGFEAGAQMTGSQNVVIGRFPGNQGGLNIATASNHIVLSDGSGDPRWYIDNTGTAGYAPSTGGTVAQTSSRTASVTLNKPTGTITLVSAAGTTAWQSFTVSNSTVAVADTIRVVQRSGTDLYQIFVTNVSTGSFRITFATTGGTTTEQPTFNFAVLKGQVS